MRHMKHLRKREFRFPKKLSALFLCVLLVLSVVPKGLWAAAETTEEAGTPPPLTGGPAAQADPSTDAFITALEVSVDDGSGSPVTRVGVIGDGTITLKVPSTAQTITVSTLTLSAGASADLAVGGTLSMGSNSVTVTAEDGTTTKEYAVTISAESNAAAVTSLTVSASDGVNPTVTRSGSISGTTITLNVPYETTTITVAALTLSEGASSPWVENTTTLNVGDNALTVTAEDGVTTETYTVTITRENKVPGNNETLNVTFFDGSTALDSAAVGSSISAVSLSIDGGAPVSGAISGDSATFTGVDGTKPLCITVTCQSSSIYETTTTAVTLGEYDGNAFVVKVVLDVKDLNVFTYQRTALGKTDGVGAWETAYPTTARGAVPAGGKVIANDGYIVKSISVYSSKIEKEEDIASATLVETVSAPALSGEFSPVFAQNIPADALDVTYVIEYETAYTITVTRRAQEKDYAGNVKITAGGNDYPVSFTDNVGKVILPSTDIGNEATLTLTPDANGDYSGEADVGGSVDTVTVPGSYVYTFTPAAVSGVNAMHIDVQFPIKTWTVTIPSGDNAVYTLYDEGGNKLETTNNAVTVDSGTTVKLGVLPNWGYSVDSSSLTCTGSSSTMTSTELSNGEVRTGDMLVRGGNLTFAVTITENADTPWSSVTMTSTDDVSPEGHEGTFKYNKDAMVEIAPVSPYTKLKIEYKTPGDEKATVEVIDGGAAKSFVGNTSVIILGIAVSQNDYIYSDIAFKDGASAMKLLFAEDTTDPVFDASEGSEDYVSVTPKAGSGTMWTSDRSNDMETKYYHGEVEVKFHVTDTTDWDAPAFNSGIAKVWITKDASGGEIVWSDPQIPDFPADPINPIPVYETLKDGKDGQEYTVDLALPTEKEATSVSYYIHAEDGAGNKKETNFTLNLDNTLPGLQDEGTGSVVFTQNNASGIAQALNFLTFGSFFKPSVTVTIKVTDSITQVHFDNEQPVNNARLVLYGADESGTVDYSEKVTAFIASKIERSGNNATLTFELPHQSKEYSGHSFWLELYDELGNKTGETAEGQTETYGIQITTDNSNLKNSGIVMIEETKPVSSLSVSGGQVYQSAQGDIYSDDVTYAVTATDSGSGLNSLRLEVNNTSLINMDYSTGGKIETSYNGTAENGGIDADADGKYVAELQVIDSAGNVADTQTVTTYIDRIAPQIVRYEFSAAGSSEPYTKDGFTEEFQENVELTEYGFYFKTQTQVTVSASDSAGANEASSEVQGIAVYIRDYDKDSLQALTADGSFVAVTENSLSSLDLTPGDEITFTIPGNFKGQIFAKATDNVGNTADEFTTPDGAIIETPELHAAEKHIEFNRPETAYKTANGQDLYAANVKVGLTITDLFSGIRSVEWSITAPQDDKAQHGTINVTEDGQVQTAGSTDCIGAWEKIEGEQNLVYQLRNTLTVSNNSNQIAVTVKMTDCSGNTSEEKAEFSIDKTAPTIQVTYNNNAPDATYTDYYNADRVATIVVTERNFDPALVTHTIANTDGVTPGLIGWTTSTNTVNPDLTTHTATITYSADGDYTFNISARDRAQNAAASFTQQQFTIDQTAPEMTVSYTAESGQSTTTADEYYNRSVTVTITVTEHNFDSGRAAVTRSMDGGASEVLQVPDGGGDVHPLTIDCPGSNTDGPGHYTFTVAYSDMAGNEGNPVTIDPFTVDQQFDSFAVSGIESKAYGKNEYPSPVISFSDWNFSEYSLNLTRQNLGEEETVELTDEGEDRNVEIVTDVSPESMNIQLLPILFDDDPENDGLYTLTLSVQDKAGNYGTLDVKDSGNPSESAGEGAKTSYTWEFTVNHYGSVFTYNNAIQTAEGNYLRPDAMESDLIITEYNPSKVTTGTVEVLLDNKPIPVNVKPESLEKGNDERQWFSYAYTIPKETFEEDGAYQIRLQTVDAEHNTSRTYAPYSMDIDSLKYQAAISSRGQTNDTEEEVTHQTGLISFWVDGTAPSVSFAGLDRDSDFIDSQAQDVDFAFSDSIGLKRAEVFVNGESKGAWELNGVSYSSLDGDKPYAVRMNESSQWQTLDVYVEDMAGNTYDTRKIREDDSSILPYPTQIMISTNAVVRWYADKPLFWGSIIGGGGALMLLIAGTAIFARRSRKRHSRKG